LKRLHRLPHLDHAAPLRALWRLLSPRPATETTGAQNWTGVVTEAAYGKRVGILGYGLIGREIHKRLAGFGTTVHYHRATPYSRAVEERIGATYLPLAEMIRACDIVFVQLPLTERTSGLIGRDLLRDCKPGLLLVNCGRAGVIESDALYTALRAGRVAYYGADVFWHEPRPLLDRFRWLRSCYVTPHMAGSLAVPQDFTARLIDALKRFVQSDLS
jgi:lactate dehydrogenase-like 2-hydroxyacid dehydrogenase